MISHILISSHLLNEQDISQLVSPAKPILLHNLTPEPDAKSIAINSLREFLSHTSLSQPTRLSTYQVFPADSLTSPAQNLLLKTLEEARSDQLFILVTPTLNRLLETIISRCKVINLQNHPTLTSEQKKELTALLNTLKEPLHILLQASDKITKDDPLAYFNRLTILLSAIAKSDPNPRRLKILRLASQTYKDLLSNVNAKLAVDHFLLQSQRTIMNPTYGR